jgi:hypothetical protein
MNDKAVTNVKRQIDTLSDGHQDVVDQAVVATGAIISLDERMKKAQEASRPLGAFPINHVKTQMDALCNQLEAQALRARRVRAEIKQIQRNLKIT